MLHEIWLNKQSNLTFLIFAQARVGTKDVLSSWAQHSTAEQSTDPSVHILEPRVVWWSAWHIDRNSPAQQTMQIRHTWHAKFNLKWEGMERSSPFTYLGLLNWKYCFKYFACWARRRQRWLRQHQQHIVGPFPFKCKLAFWLFDEPMPKSAAAPKP